MNFIHDFQDYKFTNENLNQSVGWYISIEYKYIERMEFTLKFINLDNQKVNKKSIIPERSSLNR